jgi:hypothetical protein
MLNKMAGIYGIVDTVSPRQKNRTGYTNAWKAVLTIVMNSNTEYT